MGNTFKDQRIHRQFEAAYDGRPVHEAWDGSAHIKHPQQIGRRYVRTGEELRIYWGKERSVARVALHEIVGLVNTGVPAEHLPDPAPSLTKSSIKYACS